MLQLFGEPSIINLKVYFARTWIEPMIMIWTWQIVLFEIQAMKTAVILFLTEMESLLFMWEIQSSNIDSIQK